jgi:hypothetical protein
MGNRFRRGFSGVRRCGADRGPAGIFPVRIISIWSSKRWSSKRCWRLVAGNFRVYVSGPCVDAAGEGLGVGETLVAKPEGDIERARTVVAEDYDRSIGIEFGMGPGGDFTHGHEEGVGDIGGLVLP